MSDQLHLIPADSSEWNGWLARTSHDFHHTSEHHCVWQDSGYGQGWLAVYGTPERWLAWPYLLRPVDSLGQSGLFDITAVDGYAGPLFHGCSGGDAFLATALDRIFDQWRESNVVSVFARFHPLIGNHLAMTGNAEPLCCADFPGLRHEGHTVSVALNLADPDAWGQYRKNHLYDIRRALRRGVETETVSFLDGLDDFIRLYYATMTRNGASGHYFFSRIFFERFYSALQSSATIHVARYQGRVIGAVLTTEFNGIVQYLLGGVEDEAAAFSPLKVLLEHIRCWARDRGNAVLHLGGGRGCQDGDSLFHFKSGFSDRRHCFYTGRWVLNALAYERLVSERFTGHGSPAASAFFPLYRAPLPALEVQPAECSVG